MAERASARRPYRTRDPLERFASNLTFDASGCWIWDGRLNNKGYPVFSIRSVKTYAHRWLYEHVVEAISTALEVDHLCHVPACVNPDHLEPVTHAENMRRTRVALSPRCGNGHEWTERNVYIRKDTGARQCRACAHQRYLRRRDS